MFHATALHGKTLIKMIMETFLKYLLTLWLMAPHPIDAVQTERPDAHFKSLEGRLIQDGFDREFIQEIFKNQDVSLEVRGVSLFFMHQESTLNYDQYKENSALDKARLYMQTYRDPLEAAEKVYGVPPQVVTAILLVETRLGAYTGNRLVLNSLSTMAAMSDEAVRNIIWQFIPKERRPTREQFDKKADQRTQWAYDQLKAFLSYSRREDMDPVQIRGSYAGALGVAQFIPTSILAYARDGNNDGRVDLFDHADAIASIANFLRHYGWRENIGSEDAFKVIFNYNRSSYYVNTVLEIAKKLEGST